MENFQFLEQIQEFKRKVFTENHVYYYYESKVFHAKLLIPKTEKNHLNWMYYKKEKQYFFHTDKVPSWFWSLIVLSEEKIKKRDRFLKLFM